MFVPRNFDLKLACDVALASLAHTLECGTDFDRRCRGETKGFLSGSGVADPTSSTLRHSTCHLDYDV